MTSSLRGPSQDSCRYSISKVKRSFCSALSFSTHFALSNLIAAAGAEAPGAVLDSFALSNIEAAGIVVFVAGVVAETDVCDGTEAPSFCTVGEEEGGVVDVGAAGEVEAEAT